MKIKREHYEYIREAMRPFAPRAAQLREELPRTRPDRYGPNGAGNLEKRVRWDIFNAAIPSVWVCDNLYRDGMNGPSTGVNDEHIDTALRAIMREIEA